MNSTADIDNNNMSFEDSEINEKGISPFKYFLAAISFVILVSFIVMTYFGKTILPFNKNIETTTVRSYFSDRESESKSSTTKELETTSTVEKDFTDVTSSINEKPKVNSFDKYDHETDTNAFRDFEKSDKYPDENINDDIDNYDDTNQVDFD